MQRFQKGGARIVGITAGKSPDFAPVKDGGVTYSNRQTIVVQYPRHDGSGSR
jgi:hypothetical protein